MAQAGDFLAFLDGTTTQGTPAVKRWQHYKVTATCEQEGGSRTFHFVEGSLSQFRCESCGHVQTI